MKKIIPVGRLVLVVILTISLIACSERKRPEEEDDEPDIVTCLGSAVLVDGICVDLCSAEKPEGFCEGGKTCFEGACIAKDSDEMFLTKIVYDNGKFNFHDGAEIKYNKDGKIKAITEIEVDFAEGVLDLMSFDVFTAEYDEAGRIESSEGDLFDSNFMRSFIESVLSIKFDQIPFFSGSGERFQILQIIEGVKKNDLLRNVLKDPSIITGYVENYFDSRIPTEATSGYCNNDATFDYDDEGRLSIIECDRDDYNHKSYSFTYDSKGRAIKRVLKSYRGEMISYSEATEIVRSDSEVKFIEKDVYNADIEVSDEGAYEFVLIFSYDDKGRLYKVGIEDEGVEHNLASIWYDSLGRLTEVASMFGWASFEYLKDEVKGSVLFKDGSDMYDVKYVYDLKTDKVKLDGKLPVRRFFLGFTCEMELNDSTYSGSGKAWFADGDPEFILASAKFSLKFNGLDKAESIVLNVFAGDLDVEGAEETISVSGNRLFDKKGRPLNIVYTEDGGTTAIDYLYNDSIGEMVMIEKEKDVEGTGFYSISTFRNFTNLHDGGELTEKDFLCSPVNVRGFCKEDGMVCMSDGTCGAEEEIKLDAYKKAISQPKESEDIVTRITRKLNTFQGMEKPLSK